MTVDLLPAGADLIAKGYVQWDAGVRMSLVGFEHVFERSRPVALSSELAIDVAPLEVLALLKMISYQDRPAERTHDLHDLAFLLDEYLAIDDLRRWDDPIIELQLPFEEVSAYVLGRDMAAFITARDKEQVRSFLARLHDDRDGTCSRLAALAPPSWERAEEVVRARFAAFARGLGTGTS